MGLVWDYYPEGGGELLTALALADHADHEGAGIHPGVSGLAAKTRQSERTVQYHLGQMRRTTWLRPVRYWRGGQGRATEYRINQAWINNPANFAPFAKGANDSNLGCKTAHERVQLVAPQPVVVINKTLPTTTSAEVSTAEAVVVGDEQIDIPPPLDGDHLASTLQVLAACPEATRQLVVYEAAAIVARGSLKGSAIGLLRGLCRRAAAGTFVPAYGPGFSAQRRRQLAERTPALIDRATPEQAKRRREAAHTAIANIKQQLSACRTAGNPSATTHTGHQAGGHEADTDNPAQQPSVRLQAGCDS